MLKTYFYAFCSIVLFCISITKINSSAAEKKLYADIQEGYEVLERPANKRGIACDLHLELKVGLTLL
jgi:hypothetical protein